MKIEKISRKEETRFLHEGANYSRRIEVKIEGEKLTIFLENHVSFYGSFPKKGKISFCYNSYVEQLNLKREGTKWAEKLVDAIWDEDYVEMEVPQWLAVFLSK